MTGARAYLAAVIELLERLGDEPFESIARAGAAVAAAIANGHKIWVTPTTYCLHEEATGRAGGFMAVHVLTDAALVSDGDCVLVGSPVGTSERPITFALEAQRRAGFVIALTNREFEDHPLTLLEHPTQKRLHEIADLVVNIPGPLGDGVFDVPELDMRAIPHSGVTGPAAMWMIFSEALAILRTDGVTPHLYKCVNIEGARERNRRVLAAYTATGVGYASSPSPSQGP